VTAPRAVLRRPQYARVLEAATQPLRTFAQCGEIMGVSVSRAHALEREALVKLRKGLIAAGIVDENGKVLRGGGK